MWWFVLILSLLLGGCTHSTDEPACERLIDDSRYAPLHDHAGRLFRLVDYRGQWLLINFWASWCEPCQRELPVLGALHQAYDDVQILGVNYDHLPTPVLNQLLQEQHVAFPTAMQDPLYRLQELSLPALPVTFVINPAGCLVATLLGEQTKDSLLAQLERSP